MSPWISFVPEAVTRQVVAFLARPTLLPHPGGHYVSSTKDSIEVVARFLGGVAVAEAGDADAPASASASANASDRV